VKTTYRPVMNPVRESEERADPDPGEDPLAWEVPQGGPSERSEDHGGDREADGEKGKERVELEGVLDLHERHAPDGRDGDEREQRSRPEMPHVGDGPTDGSESTRSGSGCATWRFSTLRRVDVLDTFERPLHDLRISVTDRCNFRCVYCMPKEVFGRDYRFLPRDALLTFEEIDRVARAFVGLGVRKVRITGGEPLLRRDLEVLVGRLAAVGELDLTLTTNGALLAQRVRALADAGLTRVTVSLDSLDDEVFRAMNDVDFPVARVLAGIDAAAATGLPVKVNVVVKRGLNEDSILDIARRFRGTGHTVRFIEYMDVGATNGWRLDDVVPAAEVVRTIAAEFPLEPIEASYRGEVAQRYRYCDGAGEIGVIASVTQPFCGDCTRARLSADGKIYTCLFAMRGHDLRAVLRSGANDDELASAIREIWERRTDRYSELRTAETARLRKVEMSYIGG
jgi:cyclic pyranopterin phosphate synthase